MNNQSLSYDDRYECPLCRQGEIAALALMDAYGCSFCRHIFTANLTEQVLRTEDSAVPMAWRWNGHAWRHVRSALPGTNHQDLTTLVWVFCLGLMVLPPTIVWLPLQMFPALDGSTGAWFPLFWLVSTAIAHGVMGIWLLAEHYQWGFYIASRERLRRLVAPG
jgi:rubredoxin